LEKLKSPPNKKRPVILLETRQGNPPDTSRRPYVHEHNQERHPLMEGYPKESPFHGWDMIEEDPVQYKDQFARGLQFAFGLKRKVDPIVGMASPLDKNVAVYQKPSNGDFVVVSRAGNNPHDIRIFEITNDWYGDPDPDMGGMVKRVIEMADGTGMLRQKEQYGQYLEVADVTMTMEERFHMVNVENGLPKNTPVDKTASHLKQYISEQNNAKKPKILNTVGEIGKTILGAAFAADGRQVKLNPLTTVGGAVEKTNKKRDAIDKDTAKQYKEVDTYVKTVKKEKQKKTTQKIDLQGKKARANLATMKADQFAQKHGYDYEAKSNKFTPNPTYSKQDTSKTKKQTNTKQTGAGTKNTGQTGAGAKNTGQAGTLKTNNTTKTTKVK